MIVEAEQWGLGVSRYVHLNPVRLGKLGLNKAQQQRIRVGAMGAPEAAVVCERTRQLRRYRWSSYRAYIGLARVPEWLECGGVLQLGGGGPAEQRRKYREYVEGAVREGLEKSPWEELRERVVLGGREFLLGLREQWVGDDREQRGVRRLREPRPDLASVIRCVEEVKGRKWEEFRDQHGDTGRDLVWYLGRKVCGAKLNALAELAGVKEYATVAMAVKRFAARLCRRKSLQRDHERARQLLHVKM